MKYVVAITGASGVIYGVRLVEELIQRKFEVHLVVSEPALLVMKHELEWGIDFSSTTDLRPYFSEGNLYLYNNDNIAARIASGSFICRGMIIIPCSMSTVASVANGMSNNLIERTADVMLKEKRSLVVVPRETPLSAIHLTNMLKLSEAGGVVLPAMPAFYHKPLNIDDMVSFVVGKVLDSIGVPNEIFTRYE